MMIDDDTSDLLAELGLMAAGYRMTADADAIAAALQAQQGGSSRPSIIRALSRLNGGDAPAAVRELERSALKLRPQDPMVKAFLALALHVEGRAADRDRVAGEVLEQGGEAAAVALAQSLRHA